MSRRKGPEIIQMDQDSGRPSEEKAYVCISRGRKKLSLGTARPVYGFIIQKQRSSGASASSERYRFKRSVPEDGGSLVWLCCLWWLTQMGTVPVYATAESGIGPAPSGRRQKRWTRQSRPRRSQLNSSRQEKAL